jgi:hypothetical protein
MEAGRLAKLSGEGMKLRRVLRKARHLRLKLQGRREGLSLVVLVHLRKGLLLLAGERREALRGGAAPGEMQRAVGHGGRRRGAAQPQTAEVLGPAAAGAGRRGRTRHGDGASQRVEMLGRAGQGIGKPGPCALEGGEVLVPGMVVGMLRSKALRRATVRIRGCKSTRG